MRFGKDIRDILAIIRREILDRKLLFLGAAIGAGIALTTPLLPEISGYKPLEIISISSLSLMLFTIVATPIFLGAGIINADLGEQRSGFYLARPVSVFSIWLAKVLALFLITILIGAILVVVPTLLGGGLFQLEEFTDGWKVAVGAISFLLDSPAANLGVIVLLMASQAMFWGLGLRSRTPWLLLDVLTVSVLVTATWSASLPLLIGHAEGLVARLVLSALLLLSLVLLAGHAWGFSRGRTDLQTAHSRTSVASALLMVPVAATIVGYSAWMRAVDVGELRHAYIYDAAEDGEWISIFGTKHDQSLRDDDESFFAHFLVNVETGDSRRIDDVYDAAVNAGTAAWWQIDSIFPPRATLHWIDLQDSGSQPSAEPVEIDVESLTEFAIANDGSTVTWITRGTANSQLSVYDLREGRNLMSARLPKHGSSRLVPAGGNLLRIYLEDVEKDEQWSIYEADIDAGSLQLTAKIPGGSLRVNPSWMRLWSRGAEDAAREVSTWDPRTGELRATTTTPPRGGLLWNGDVYQIVSDPPAVISRSPDGVVSNRIELPAGRIFPQVKEVLPGTLAISVGTPGQEDDWQFRETLLIDLGTGRTESLGKGVTPYMSSWQFWTHPHPPGSVYARLFRIHTGGLGARIAILDSETHELRTLTGEKVR